MTDTPARFHIASPIPTHDGTWLCAFRRPPLRLLGGTASGPTPDAARVEALATVREIMARDGEAGHG